MALINVTSAETAATRPVRFFAIKAQVPAPCPATLEFRAEKTMYGGKQIAAGAVIFVFASEHDGGTGLVARGVVTAASAVPRRRGVERQTPRVNVSIHCTDFVKRPFGRADLKPFSDWNDGCPETELNFKFYRQATNKIAGLSPKAGAFLDRFFPRTSSTRTTAAAPVARVAPPTPPTTGSAARFQGIVAALQEFPAVTLGAAKKGFGSAALCVNGKIFAMLTAQGSYVVKLPRSRVDSLVSAGSGTRFEPAPGRVMKEWFAASGRKTIAWLALAREALEFVRRAS